MNNRKKLQNIAINHSADIDYKDFVKIYRECTYECLTGENLEYKPSVVEQAKFDYSPLGKIFNDEMKEENKKEGLLKSVENIGDKNEDLLKAFSAANTVSKAAKNQNNYNYDNIFSFYGFTETLKQIIFKRM